MKVSNARDITQKNPVQQILVFRVLFLPISTTDAYRELDTESEAEAFIPMKAAQCRMKPKKTLL